MKRFVGIIVAIISVLFWTASSFAAPAALPAPGQRPYYYSSSGQDAYNSVQIYLSGSIVRIVRQSYQDPLEPDLIQIHLQDRTVLSLSQEWEDEPVAGSNYGYDMELDTAKLADGEYTLTINSSAIEWSDGEYDKPTGSRSAYLLTSVRLVKQGTECYFPQDNSLSGRYNRILLQQLRAGEAPNDFMVLQEYYKEQENSYILADIERKTKELTSGLPSDLEKCLAIHRWIAHNIAYDYDLPREDIEHWLLDHPEDAVRQEDPLHAFQSGYAMCYGYAKLTTLMLGYAGIDSVYVRGYLQDDIRNAWNGAAASDDYRKSWNTEVPRSWFSTASDGTEVPDLYNHAWNAVKISGSWYFLDTCKDAMYGYYRWNSGDPNTSYTELNQCFSGIYAFPSLDRLSDTHMPTRYGADGHGKRLQDK